MILRPSTIPSSATVRSQHNPQPGFLSPFTGRAAWWFVCATTSLNRGKVCNDFFQQHPLRRSRPGSPACGGPVAVKLLVWIIGREQQHIVVAELVDDAARLPDPPGALISCTVRRIRAAPALTAAAPPGTSPAPRAVRLVRAPHEAGQPGHSRIPSAPREAGEISPRVTSEIRLCSWLANRLELAA